MLRTEFSVADAHQPPFAWTLDRLPCRALLGAVIDVSAHHYSDGELVRRIAA